MRATESESESKRDRESGKTKSIEWLSRGRDPGYLCGGAGHPAARTAWETE